MRVINQWQAEEAATESCELEWYRLPDKKARNVVLLMIMSNMPTKISVGNVIDLSFETFGTVSKCIQLDIFILYIILHNPQIIYKISEFVL